MIDPVELQKIITVALNEDIQAGDITTEATIEPGIQARAEMLVKEKGFIAGIDMAERVFLTVDPGLKFTRQAEDGGLVFASKVIATIEGSAASILKAERTALNFIQRMSGVASYAREYVDAVKHTNAQILDTRKTVPGLRLLDKYAVECAGCKNHRIGLFDMFLIKDNHIAVAGSITKAVNACKEYNRKNGTSFAVEVEVKNLDEVREALQVGPDRIMLDNFDIETTREAVELIGGKAETEASGGINMQTVVEVAEAGVDFISIGAITHSVKALDISLNISILQ